MKFPSPRRFFSAVVRFFKRPELVPLGVEVVRRLRCQKCPQFENDQCQSCTCYIPLKVKLATESCPLGKWRQFYNDIKHGL